MLFPRHDVSDQFSQFAGREVRVEAVADAPGVLSSPRVVRVTTGSKDPFEQSLSVKYGQIGLVDEKDSSVREFVAAAKDKGFRVRFTLPGEIMRVTDCDMDRVTVALVRDEKDGKWRMGKRFTQG